MNARACLLLVILCTSECLGQTKSMADYIDVAKQNNPQLQDLIRQQHITSLQFELSRAPFRHPQVSLTADYLFAPFFNSNGKAIALTNQPSADAIGYDPSLSNGGLYAAQINVAMPLLDGGYVNAISKQSVNSIQQIKNSASQIEHAIEKNVGDLFINAYQVQQQLKYADTTIVIIEDRKSVVEALVLKGLLQQTDYLLLEIELQSRRYDKLQLSSTLSDAIIQLNAACGSADTGMVTLQKPTIRCGVIRDQFNFQSRFELDSMSIVIQRMVTETKYHPQLQAFANAGLNASSLIQPQRNVGLSAGLHFSLPLYDGNQQSIIEQQLGAQLQSLQQYRSMSVLQLRSMLVSLLRQAAVQEESLKLLATQIERQRTLLAIIHDKVVIGQVSVTDYLLAVQDFAASQQKRIQSEATLWQLSNQFNFLNW